MDWFLLLELAIKSIILIFVLLGGFAYLTWYERKALARLQSRYGPNRAGPKGLLQPIADAIKLIFKEELTPSKAEKVLFLIAPIITVVPAVIITATIPWGPDIQLFGRNIHLYIADLNVGVLYITSIASIAVYGIVLAGWSSNNKYAMLGGLRSTAQMVSYELSLGLSFVVIVLIAGSLRLIDIVEAQRVIWVNLGSFQIPVPMWNAFIQPVGAVIFMIATLAELNRSPFDMPEAEQELAAGYHTEYSGMKFALFFMAEYTKMIAIAAIMATLFFGGYLGPDITKIPLIGQYLTLFVPVMGPFYIFIKIVVILGWMIWVRATLPRIRYDRLMSFGWKIMLPLSLAVVFFTAIGIVLNMLWLGTILSLIAGWFVTLLIDRMLRRKAYA